MAENVIVKKTYSFAVRVVKFYWEMQERKKDYVISKQLLKSGTNRSECGRGTRGNFKSRIYS